jgi:peptidoglycan/xylan/chitin deacetylase (PgdA/CDA1 family)
MALVVAAALAAMILLSRHLWGSPRGGVARAANATPAGAVVHGRAKANTHAIGFHGPTISAAAARRGAVPILMYHVIAPPPPGTPYPELWVPPRTFAAQARALAGAGFTGVTLDEVWAAWKHGARLPRHPIVLSFDDGYASDATRAAPVLRRLGWPGVLNLAIQNTGATGLRLGALHALVRDGWELDSHTVNHPDLTTLAPVALKDELVRSRAWIRRHLHVNARFFCYPAGRFDATVIAAVRAAGYSGATTELPGVARARDDPYELPRIRVTAQLSPSELLNEIRTSGG